MSRPSADHSLCRYLLALSEESRFSAASESASFGLHVIDPLLT